MRQRRAHTQSADGGGRFKAIIIHSRMHRDGGGGSDKACSGGKKKKCSECQQSTKTRFEARRCRRRQRDEDGAEFYIGANTKRLTLTFLRAWSACLHCVCARMYAFTPPEFYLQLLSTLLHQTELANFLTLVEAGARSLAWTGGWYSPGVCVSGWAVTQFSLLPQPK